MTIDEINVSEVVKAVKAFNDIYGEMESALWCLSKAARKDLLKNQPSDIVKALVWTVRSWWGVQGVQSSFKEIAAKALVKMQWNPEMFQENKLISNDAEDFAHKRVMEFLKLTNSLGSPRQEFSLVSKVLHWLLPWRISVYDSFVRKSAEISESVPPAQAYREILHWQFRYARQLATVSTEWMGDRDPKSPLRALDKYLWWKGGGNAGTAALVKNPWAIVRGLGIEKEC